MKYLKRINKFFESKEEDLEFEFLIAVSKFLEAIIKVIQVHELYYYKRKDISVDSQFKKDIKSIIDTAISQGIRTDEIIDKILSIVKEGENKIYKNNKFGISIKGLNHSMFQILDDLVSSLSSTLKNKNLETVSDFLEEIEDITRECDETWIWQDTDELRISDFEEEEDEYDDEDEERDQQVRKNLQKFSTPDKVEKYLENAIGKKIEDFDYSDKVECYTILKSDPDIIKGLEVDPQGVKEFLSLIKNYLEI